MKLEHRKARYRHELQQASATCCGSTISTGSRSRCSRECTACISRRSHVGWRRREPRGRSRYTRRRDAGRWALRARGHSRQWGHERRVSWARSRDRRERRGQDPAASRACSTRSVRARSGGLAQLAHPAIVRYLAADPGVHHRTSSWSGWKAATSRRTCSRRR
jgi:hypothetical protein